MFSMAAVATPRLLDVDAEALARLGVLLGTNALLSRPAVLPLDWPELEETLPDRGLPRGVVEIAAMPWSSSRLASRFGSMRGGTTSIALAAVRSAHAADATAWCAWITPSDAPSLYAPAVAQAGVDLARLLVVRPSTQALARTAVKVASSGAFDIVVVDAPSGLDGRLGLGQMKRGSAAKVDGAVVVRKLALAAEERGTSSILLTSAVQPHSVPWPVALRLEVERRPEALAIRVAKDRRGRASSQHVVRIAS